VYLAGRSMGCRGGVHVANDLQGAPSPSGLVFFGCRTAPSAPPRPVARARAPRRAASWPDAGVGARGWLRAAPLPSLSGPHFSDRTQRLDADPPAPPSPAAIRSWRSRIRPRTSTRSCRSASPHYKSRPSPRTNRTSLVPPIVLTGQVSSLPALQASPPPRATAPPPRADRRGRRAAVRCTCTPRPAPF